MSEYYIPRSEKKDKLYQGEKSWLESSGTLACSDSSPSLISQDSEIIRSFKELELQINTWRDNVKRLNDKLKPILYDGPVAQTEEKGKPKDSSCVPLANDILDFSEQIYVFNLDLHNIIKTIGL